MEKAIKRSKAQKWLAMVSFLLFCILHLNAQPNMTIDKGYAPANGIKVYYEVYGEGRPIILIHGAFYTIDLNWNQLIPELSKTRKVIAIEMQGHGHTPYSDRKLDFKTLANDVESVMDYLKIDSADVVGYSWVV